MIIDLFALYNISGFLKNTINNKKGESKPESNPSYQCFHSRVCGLQFVGLIFLCLPIQFVACGLRFHVQVLWIEIDLFISLSSYVCLCFLWQSDTRPSKKQKCGDKIRKMCTDRSFFRNTWMMDYHFFKTRWDHGSLHTEQIRLLCSKRRN